MRLLPRVLIALTLGLLANLIAAGTSFSQTPPRQTAVAIANVTVVDLRNGRLVPDQTVIVSGRRIASVSSAAEAPIPAGAAVIDGAGRFLMPGLWDMHVHLLSNTPGLYIANGVTGVREMGTSLQSIDQNVDLRRRIAEGELVGPRYFVGVTINDRPGGRTHVVGAGNAEAGRAAVDSLRRAGADFIKVYDGLSREVYLAVADEARRQGIPFAGHVPTSVTLEEAARSGQRSFEHLLPHMLPLCSSRSADLRATIDELSRLAASGSGPDSAQWHAIRGALMFAVETYDEDRCRAETRRLAEHGMWQVPTLTAGMRWPGLHDDSILRDPRLAYAPAPLRPRWEQARSVYLSIFSESDQRKLHNLLLQIVAVLHGENVGILAGTDAPGVPFTYAGFSLHDELRHLVNAGLTPVEALRTATLEPARFFELEDSIGAVEEGFLADLVLLDANPIEAIGNTLRIHGVVANGRYFDRAALDALLVQARIGPTR